MVACGGAGRWGVLADGQRDTTGRGHLPAVTNIHLHAFDRAWAQHGTGELVRYADDFVVLCGSAAQAEQALTDRRRVGMELKDVIGVLNLDTPLQSVIMEDVA